MSDERSLDAALAPASEANASGERAPEEPSGEKVSVAGAVADAPPDADAPGDAEAPTSGPQPRATGEAFRLEAAAPLVCGGCSRANPADARFCMSCGLGLRGDEPVIELRKDADPLVGRVIAGRYKIDEVIGRGGMGVVYRVEHVRMGKLMAMKLLHGDLARDKEVVRRFRREAEAVSKLDHPNTVQIFDFGESDGMTWLVMELLSGKDLGVVLAETHTLDFARAARLAWQVAGSVHQAHERGIVHRDLKPENIRVLSDRTEVEFVKVLDFGLAKLRETEEQKRASITREGFLVGTPYYMAPEHIRGDAVDARSDVYALGAVLYKMVTGMPPFWATTPVAVLTKHLTEDPIPPRRRSARRDLPSEADEIILRALEKDPRDRYQSMVELREALSAYLASVGDEPASGRHTLPAASPLPTESGRRVAIATRDEFDRYEQQVRTQDVIGRVVMFALVVVAALTSWWAWGDSGASAASRETEPNDTVTEANLIGLGAPLTGHLGARVDSLHGDTDVFSLGRLPPDVRWLDIDFSGLPNADMLLEVYVRGRPDPILLVDGAGYGHPEGAPNMPVDPSAEYVLRVREHIEPGRYPIEAPTDSYELVVRPYTPEEGVEREPNETRDAAAAAAVPSSWRGFVGWSSDEDLYCLDDAAPRAEVVLSGVPMLDLDLAITWRATGRTLDVNEGGAGEGERFVAEAPGALCVRVASRDGPARSDPENAYTLSFAAAPEVTAPEDAPSEAAADEATPPRRRR